MHVFTVENSKNVWPSHNNSRGDGHTWSAYTVNYKRKSKNKETLQIPHKVRCSIQER